MIANLLSIHYNFITFIYAFFITCQILTFEQCSTVYTTKKREDKKEKKRECNALERSGTVTVRTVLLWKYY